MSTTITTNFNNTSYSPVFFNLNNWKDKELYNSLLQNNHSIQIFNEIQGQLIELIKIKNPTKRIKSEEYEFLIEKHLNEIDIFEYGLWVYYPWSNRMVHILPEQEFIELRTSANRNKITTAEQEILRTKKVGIIGLSVGQSVAVTIALERTCSELRLADFDTLELNNLNRIRTGIHNLGLLKVYSVAREIAEIDPFIKIVCYPEGITENNINDFLTFDGNLDILIDECDGINIKILCRIKAKEFRIPVVMEASDRGTVDIERFDLEPNISIMHGWLDHLKIDFDILKGLKTSEEKVPYMLPISGFDTLSTRMKASMTELENTITTWPQLASAVTLGGGIVTDVCRRIFLNQFTKSGRFFIDMETLIADKEIKESDLHLIEDNKIITEQEMLTLILDLNLQPNAKQLDIDLVKLKIILEAAISAPSGGNAQPWRWKYHNKFLYLFYNLEYKIQLVDFNNTAAYISYGAAVENLILRSHELKLEVHLNLFPLGFQNNLIMAISFFEADEMAVPNYFEPHLVDELAYSIQNRTANRKLSPKINIEEHRLKEIVNYVNTISGANLSFITDDTTIQQIGEIIAKADRIRIMNKGGHIDFLAETIWTDEEAKKYKRGIEVNSLDLTPSEKVGLKIISEWDVIDYLNKWGGGKNLEKISQKTIDSSSAIGLITMPNYSKENFINGGRAVERAWLAATKDNLAFQPLTISTFLFNRLTYEGNKLFSTTESNELTLMMEDFEKLFSLNENHCKIFLFRLFITDHTPKKSLRVSLDEVFSS